MTRAALPLLFCSPIVLVACYGTAPSRPVVEFPNSATVAELAARAPAAPTVPQGQGAPEGWQLEAPLPTAVSSPGGDHWTAETPWEQAFAAHVAAAGAGSPRLTAALACTARQIGRFVLAKNGSPDESLRTFMAGACGASGAQTFFATVGGNVPDGVPDAQLLSQWRQSLEQRTDEALRFRPTAGGFWWGRSNGHAIAVIAFDVERAELLASSLIADDHGDVTIEGRARGSFDYLAAYVNRGALAVAPCEIDVAVPRPRFRVVCRLAPDDRATWVQIMAAAPKRVLATTIVQAVVRRTADETPAYAASVEPPQPVATAAEFNRVVLERLNALRAQAGLRPVELAAAQSATAGGLAAHYFGAVYRDDGAATADTIALGLLAGWNVDGMIRTGTFHSSLLPGAHDAGRWLAHATELPAGRASLLDPGVEQVAFGPLLSNQPELLGAVVTGYKFHHGADHSDDRAQVLSRVLSARTRRHLEAPKRLGGMSEVLAYELGRVHEGKQSPGDALQASLATAAERFRSNMRGWVLEATSLDAVQIPEEVIGQSHLYLEVAVTHHKAPGAAWAQLVIVILYVDQGGDVATAPKRDVSARAAACPRSRPRLAQAQPLAAPSRE